jgi:predicted nucleic acid-binding protein
MSGGMASALDASALLALVRAEPGAAVVLAALAEPGNVCYAHEVNLCEVFYVQAREQDDATAAADLERLLTVTGVVAYATRDREFLREVGRLRARITSERLAASLADCFCAATARALSCELLIADHREFEPIAALGLCRVTFIR